MLDAKAGRFYQAALQSGLIDEAGLEACWAVIPEEKRTADAVDRRLARQAISSNRLTLWQAQQLLAGRSNGFKIDKYVLLDLLGRGGMGRVYLAKDTRLGRRIALKVLSQGADEQPPGDHPVPVARPRSGPSSSTRTSSGCTTRGKPTASASWSWSTSTARTSAS